MSSTDTVVIGLDGATWSSLDPWIESGDLPNIKALKEDSAWGHNRSFLPPSTFPNWKCYSTGKNPGKFGEFWFESVDVDNGSISVPDSRSFKSPELWDYLNEEDMRVGVVNMPTTFPPKSIDGYVVAGGPRSDDNGYTYPPELEFEIERDLDYAVHPEKLPINKEDDNEDAIQAIYEVVDARFDVLERLLEGDLDFVHMTVFYINVLQHFFGASDSVKEGWERIDERIGAIREECDNLIIMSDHGSGEIHTVFWINTWLENEEYLQTTGGPLSALFSEIGERRDAILSAARTLGLESLLRRLTPEQIQMRIQQGGVHQKQSKEDLIDWDASTAIASGQGPIYLNAPTLDEAELETLRSELAEKLSDLCSPISGGPIANDIHLGEDLYSGRYADAAPDLVVEQVDGVHIDGGVGRSKEFEGPTKWHSENYRTGLYLFDSDQCKGGVDTGEMNIVDLAPTILHLLGCAVPNDIDGSVQFPIFAGGSEAATRDVEYREPLDDTLGRNSDNGQSTAKDRLEDLGYLS
jgi:predicted AlkP superfamily phosphohydrolase/phosphomutase